jgi:hypothetical protein
MYLGGNLNSAHSRNSEVAAPKPYCTANTQRRGGSSEFESTCDLGAAPEAASARESSASLKAMPAVGLCELGNCPQTTGGCGVLCGTPWAPASTSSPSTSSARPSACTSPSTSDEGKQCLVAANGGRGRCGVVRGLAGVLLYS